MNTHTIILLILVLALVSFASFICIVYGIILLRNNRSPQDQQGWECLGHYPRNPQTRAENDCLNCVNEIHCIKITARKVVK